MADKVRYKKGAVAWNTNSESVTDTSLVQDAWEVALASGLARRFWTIRVEQTNNGATTETFEFEFTISTRTYTWTQTNMVSGTGYYLTWDPDSGGPNNALNTTWSFIGTNDADKSRALVGKDGQIRYRQTTTVDATAAQIEMMINYDDLEYL